ncbi:MAG: hotdog fold thioesterase [Chitinophagaceae bacterium]|nr:hotdog fold thioesterase [Chitinophagaceae bacterium]MBK8311665.1 hotdog fold thioesterase [Chitinophagaceae bacterium]MBK8605778.1 hotdog fold thioesterase [Chitinophagaceae bacterium]MBP6477881.1 hotdog fold thioesterase [Chitinophagaceae bacterium]MBP7315817.1 hotdog fold thioesterase [Chitinophagaceae bacterium]
MSIWFNKELSIEKFSKVGQKTMGDFLGIEWVEIGDDFIKARMPVDERTKQPYGLLHGGASCVLAETIGSIASAMVIDTAQFQCVGLEINANHVHSATSGYVTGIALPLHLGKSTHVWDIKIYNEEEKMVCVSRLTVAIIQKRDFSKTRSL